MKQIVQKELLSKHMSRKEFLKLAGIMLLSAIGIANFIASLRAQLGGTHTNSQPVSHGFGSSKFGV